MAILRITGGCAYETGCFSLRLAVRAYGCTVWVGRILWLSALRNLHGCESRQPLEAYPYRIRLGRPEVVLSWSSGKFFGRSDGSHGLKLNEILTTSVYSSLNRDWIDALFYAQNRETKDWRTEFEQNFICSEEKTDTLEYNI